MKRIADIFLRNTGWKLLSLVLAAVLWFVGTNVTDPTQDRRFLVALAILNKETIEQNNLILLNDEELEKELISIRVRAARSVLDRLNAERWKINAYIDLKPIDVSYADKVGEPQSLSVLVEMPNYISDEGIISRDPPNVQILLDNYVEKEIPIKVDPMGTPEEGYLTMTPVVSPDTITVRGAKSELDRIESARAQVNLQGADDTVEAQVPIVILDSNESDITKEFDFDTKETHVTVQIYKYKSVSLEALYIGNLEPGYRIAGVTIEPSTVQVVGNPDELNALDSIALTPYMNLDGISRTTSKTYDIRQLFINTGLSIRNNTPHEATVTVNIEKESVKEITVSTETLRVIGIDYAVDLPPEVKLVVRGAAENVEALTTDTITGTIDLSGLSPGEHEVDVQFDLPSGVTQLGESAKVAVIISEPEQ